MNIIIEIRNARGEFMEFLNKHNLMQTYYSFYDTDISHVWYVGGTPGTTTGWFNGVLTRGEPIPEKWKGVKGTVEEFIPYYEGKIALFRTTDTTYIPSVAGPEDYGRCSTTVTRDPDSGKVTHLHTKFLPTMNAYNTLALLKEQEVTTSRKKLSVSDLVVLPFEIRLGRSSENIRAEMIRLLPANIDFEDVTIMIQPIF